MRFSQIVLVVILFCASLGKVVAQGGSNYSALGIGDLRRNPGAFYEGMAGTAYAMPSTHGINLTNPALLGMSTLTRLQVGYKFQQHLVTQGSNQLAQNNGELDGLVALFGIDTTYGFGISFGLSAYSNVNYLVSRPIFSDVSGVQVSGRSEQLGEGGTSGIHVGASFRPFQDVYIGVQAQSLFGVIRQSDQIILDGQFDKLTNLSTYDIRGVVLKVGAYWNVSKFWSIGGVISGGPSASVNNARRAVAVQGQNVFFDSTQVFESDSPLPFTVGLGVSYADNNTTWGMDLEMMDASALTINSRAGVTNGTAIRASLGMNKTGAQTSLAPFIERIGIRTGVAYQQLYTTVLGNSIYEMYGAFGVNFPLGATAIVDASINAGYRGAAGGSGINELFSRFSVSVNIGEQWFKPFARD